MSKQTCEQCRFWDPEQLYIDVTDAATDDGGKEMDKELLDMIDGLGYCRAYPPSPGMPDHPWDNLAVSSQKAWCGKFDEGIDYTKLDDMIREQRAVNEGEVS